jgi:nucleotide-binding universal stress UspA family protein
MGIRMRLLFGYDGSSYADAALEDLRRAGLPREVEALVVSVGDAPITPPLASHEVLEKAFTSRRVSTVIEQANKQASQSMEESRTLAANASVGIQSFFPGWSVRAEAVAGAPSRELIQKATAWKADLIVVGSRGRSALGRLLLGSVSTSVAAEAPCSVRVARRGIEKDDDAPLRIIVGVDGSPGAERALRAVRGRPWPEGTEVRIIAVNDGVSPTRIAEIHPIATESITVDNEDDAVKARVTVERAAEDLRALALNTSTIHKQGDPRTVLIEEAQTWAADCIFVGALGFDSARRGTGLGSVATGLVTNARCTVEVVR